MALRDVHDPGSPWAKVPEILSRIRPPEFPDRDFDVTDFGAQGDGTTNALPAFTTAIADCHASGGGRVVVPAGVYLLNGPIYLRSNVNLYIEARAKLVFGTNPDDYLVGASDHNGCVLVRWEGTRCFNYSPLIYAYGEQNIAVTGGGTIDGQAGAFWYQWKRLQEPDKQRLRAMGAEQVALEQRIFGKGYHLRPSLFHPYECSNVLFQGVTVRGSPCWSIHPVFCTNVTIRSVCVEPGTTNDDGCDPDSCRDVLIEDCRFHTADDNIAIKAGRDQDAWGGPPCENVIVRNCTLVYSRANGICIGSELSGDVRNVFVEQCRIHWVRDGAISVKSNPDRGGTIENFFVRNVSVDDCGNLVRLDTRYKDVFDSPYPTTYHRFAFEGLTCHTAREVGIESIGQSDGQIIDLALRNVRITRARSAAAIERTEKLYVDQVVVNGIPLQNEGRAHDTLEEDEYDTAR